MNKIGIFGGSFDPIHIAHTFVAEESIKILNLDKLFFVPTFINPDKIGRKSASPEDRINMINLVKPEKSEVSLFEINRKNISYSIDTLKYFKSKYPNDQLFFIIGSDNINKINKWEGIDWIYQNVQIVVFRREKLINKINIKKYKAILLDNKILDYSSSNYKKGNTFLVDKKVQCYIGKNLLYGQDIAINNLEAKRYKHSVATEVMATKIAKKLNFDLKAAAFSGLMHDITKNWDIEEHYKFLEEQNYPNFNKVEKHKLHQISASIWLKNIFLVENEQIINSIGCHTTLKNDLSLLDKIVFVADKICEGRKYEGIQKVRKLALENFDEAFKLVVKRTWDFNLEKNIPLSEEQINIYRKWSQ
ncbi:nicotinate-nucleotide adenylyltransferase [[Mycoplasma] mobile]|uniref:Probable nicotinate-nucleotide adenylyltransferase n=1 Tax=Mycoplasma mobile (strain ATCC 43663 / 163K / NCTC 11711) TaxID=267748 RepID=Q6KI14_MYCM1|nr:nicotinate-nucleotide adenylyltransferase [[Mycoplasma] mobile]AAT27762.1 bidomainal protein [Mycoplasma mobile 163K]